MDEETIKEVALTIMERWMKEKENNPYEDFLSRIPKTKEE